MLSTEKGSSWFLCYADILSVENVQQLAIYVLCTEMLHKYLSQFVQYILFSFYKSCYKTIIFVFNSLLFWVLIWMWFRCCTHFLSISFLWDCIGWGKKKFFIQNPLPPTLISFYSTLGVFAICRARSNRNPLAVDSMHTKWRINWLKIVFNSLNNHWRKSIQMEIFYESKIIIIMAFLYSIAECCREEEKKTIENSI